MNKINLKKPNKNKKGIVISEKLIWWIVVLAFFAALLTVYLFFRDRAVHLIPFL